MTYQEFVFALKVKARDVRRVKAVARFLDALASLKGDKERLLKESARHAYGTKVTVRELNESTIKLEDDDPDKADKQTDLEKEIKSAEEHEIEYQEENAKTVKELEKFIVETEQKIKDTESGVTKMDQEKIDEIVSNWLSTMRPEDVPEDFEGSDKGDKISTESTR